MTVERRYALIYVNTGDYLCPSNDGTELWRFTRYEDGPALGAEVAGTFWAALRAPMPSGGVIEGDDLDLMEFVHVHVQLRTRRDAINVMLEREAVDA